MIRQTLLKKEEPSVEIPLDSIRPCSSKFLGFMVHQIEIDANLDKVQIVLIMNPPAFKKEVQ